jgi:tetratricopeptide (TPR) repeat protein
MDIALVLRKANEALQAGSFDYAVDLFTQVIHLKPDNVEARSALRQAEIARYEKNPPGALAKFFGYLTCIPFIIFILFARLVSRPEAAMRGCEKVLRKFPKNSFFLTQLGKASYNARYWRTSILALEDVHAAKPKNLTVLRYLGRLYKEVKDIPTAISRYQELLNLRPQDIEAERAMRDLAALEIVDSVGWQDTASFRDKIRDAEVAERLEEAQRFIRTREDLERAIERTKQELEDRPDRAILWLRLGDYFKQMNDFQQSESAYKKAIELEPDSFTYKTRLGDLRIARIDDEIATLREEVKKAPEDPLLVEKLKQTEEERKQVALEELTKRVEVYPTDTELRFRLGMLLFDMEKTNQATSQFQQTVRDPKLRRRSLNMLGQCFARRGLYDLAVKQFNTALEGITVMDDEAKGLVYNLGKVYEEMGDFDKAKEQYSRIYEADINFRDIAERMESVYPKVGEIKEGQE